MSHIGKRKINIPDNVDFRVEANIVRVKGPKGEISVEIPSTLEFRLEAKEFSLFPKSDGNKTKAVWGLTNALVSNAVKGAVNGFSRQLEIKGVGYMASVQGNKLILLLGFSHPMEITAPQGIAFNVEKNIITISGIDKQLVGEIAAKIRDMKKPEPYKGKGIRYVGEYVRQKAGKKAIGSGF